MKARQRESESATYCTLRAAVENGSAACGALSGKECMLVYIYV